MDCFSCIHKDFVPGSTHVICRHPFNDRIFKSRQGMIILLQLATKGFTVQLTPKELNLKLNSSGIKGGWCNYPFDFDPIWIENCDGFEEKNDKIQKIASRSAKKSP